jgi:hypothetical protein
MLATLRMKALPLPPVAVADGDAVAHAAQHARRVLGGLAVAHLQLFGTQVVGVAAQLCHAGLERVARARALFPEQHEQRAVAQQRVRFVAVELALQVEAGLDREFQFIAGPLLRIDEMASLQRLAHGVSLCRSRGGLPWLTASGPG